MRLTAADVRQLPGGVALIDRDGRLLSSSADWMGAGPGARSYRTGRGRVVVAGGEVRPELDWAVGELLRTVDAVGGLAVGIDATRIGMLSAGLRLVAGLDPGGSGTIEVLREGIDAAASARSRCRVIHDGGGYQGTIPAVMAIALAVVQVIVNAELHAGVPEVRVMVTHGPTITVAWEDTGPARGIPEKGEEFGGPAIPTARAISRRGRWGMGYARHVADTVGGSMSDLHRVPPGRMGVSLGLGTSRLMLPLATANRTHITGATSAWTEETSLGLRDTLRGTPGIAAAAAFREPDTTVDVDWVLARASGDTAWLIVPPEDSMDRAREVVGGLAHERLLWSAPEPQATTAYALAEVISRGLGDPATSAPPTTFARDFARSCAALGIAPQSISERLELPDPRVTAYLLRELDGELEDNRGHVAVRPAPAHAGHPLVRLFPRSEGVLLLT